MANGVTNCTIVTPPREKQSKSEQLNSADEYGRRIVGNETNENRDPTATLDTYALRETAWISMKIESYSMKSDKSPS